MTVTLHLGDCLEYMRTMPDKSVDAIITDLPYGTTQCSWDVVIPFEPMWEQVKRINKGVFVTTASQPFTSQLVLSNRDWFRQELIWDKVLPVGFLDANRRHMRAHENIEVFSAEGYSTYNPIMTRRGIPRDKGNSVRKSGQVYGDYKQQKSRNNEYYPTTIITVSNGDRTRKEVGYHPTQKPVSLYEYLILTYTNEGDTVLDFTCGSGTTGVACIKTNRNCILVDNDPTYFAIAERRIKDAQAQPLLFEASL